MAFALQAHAKINLHLDVGLRRKNGYHSLKTIFQEISLHDTLHFSPSSNGRIQLSVEPRGLSTGADNLVVMALHLLRSALRVKQGVKIHLEKRIPMGAGLGGGSSDAAAALWGGWLLWKQKNISSKLKNHRRNKIPPVLFRCAQKLGADVPFFLRGGAAYAEGIGDKLKPLRSPRKQWMVLIYPRVHVSTPQAYRWLDQARDKNIFRQSDTKKNIHSQFFNSFEPVVLPRFRAIAKAQATLVKLGCRSVMMSGSGSTVFGLVKTQQQAEKVLLRIKNRSWDAYLAHTI